jgi:uncharacterized Zn finger protein
MEHSTRPQTATQVHLDCEVCSRTSVVEVPAQRAPLGIVDCPLCGDTYIVSLDAAACMPPRWL